MPRSTQPTNSTAKKDPGLHFPVCTILKYYYRVFRHYYRGENDIACLAGAPARQLLSMQEVNFEKDGVCCNFSRD